MKTINILATLGVLFGFLSFLAIDNFQLFTLLLGIGLGFALSILILLIKEETAQ